MKSALRKILDSIDIPMHRHPGHFYNISYGIPPKWTKRPVLCISYKKGSQIQNVPVHILLEDFEKVRDGMNFIISKNNIQP